MLKATAAKDGTAAYQAVVCVMNKQTDNGYGLWK